MEMSSALRSLAALAHVHRLGIFRLLVQHGPEGLPAGMIAERLGLPGATASFHLKELAGAGLAVAVPQSRFIYYRAHFDAMNGLIGYLTENCCQGNGACVTDCGSDDATACATGCATACADVPHPSTSSAARVAPPRVTTRRAGKSTRRRAA
jgi:DNA-binding transcriptional ArsR family regulator